MDLAGVVLAAGFGTRLRPLTALRPKPLCPVANVALVDHAISRLRDVGADVAVNVHHHRGQMEQHLTPTGVHISVEEDRPLGTAGAVGNLRSWIDDRPTIVTNADSWHPGGVGALLEGWDGERIRLFVVEDEGRADFGTWRMAGTSLMPPWSVAALQAEPGGLYEVLWSDAHRDGKLELVPLGRTFVACDTPTDYLRANLCASGGESVVAAGAVVDGAIERCVVWDGAAVHAGERLVECVRAGTPEDPITVEAPQ